MKMRMWIHLASLLIALTFFSAPSFAAGGGGGGSGGGNSGGGMGGGGSGAGNSGGGSGNSGTVVKCKRGMIWSRPKGKCVVPQQGKVDDDSIYEAGRNLAMLGRYGEAITVLTMTANKSDPRVLNYLGYSHRKQGRVVVGLGYYQEALRSNPNYTPAREYLGEAYLQLGDMVSAREQLSEIEKRCGTTCVEYTMLDAQIEAYTKILVPSPYPRNSMKRRTM
jgi:tetratricopeptide (TPR) repeat protein